MNKEEQRRLVEEQFAIDYNCTVEDFNNTDTLVTLRKNHPDARKFEEESPLSILSYRDKIVITADEIEDMLGVKIINDNGEMVAVAGASNNSDRMWEMGVNSFTEGKGYGKNAISILEQEVQKLGKVPFYGTAMSHLASQRVALNSGMTPAFTELRSVHIE